MPAASEVARRRHTSADAARNEYCELAKQVCALALQVAIKPREDVDRRVAAVDDIADPAREGLVHEFALSYAASFISEPERIVYCEHGNQFDPANARRDYADPLDTPLGDHIVTDLVPRIPTGRTATALHLSEVDRVFPLTLIPEWVAGRLFTTWSRDRSAGSCFHCSSFSRALK